MDLISFFQLCKRGRLWTCEGSDRALPIVWRGRSFFTTVRMGGDGLGLSCKLSSQTVFLTSFLDLSYLSSERLGPPRVPVISGNSQSSSKGYLLFCCRTCFPLNPSEQSFSCPKVILLADLASTSEAPATVIAQILSQVNMAVVATGLHPFSTIFSLLLSFRPKPYSQH